MSAQIATYKKYPLEIVRGQGSFVWDSQGKEYLDYYGGHAVCLLGHSPERVVKAISNQASKLLFYSNIFYLSSGEKLAEILANTLNPEVYQVYFANSGSDANETALRVARKFKNKKQIISFNNSFHGRGPYAIAATGMPAYQQFSPNFLNFTSFATLGDMESVKNAYKEDTAAIIVEPIASIGGVLMSEKIFYQNLENFCKEKNILLIFDEVQTGLGRTGEFWFSKSLEVTPDIITTAKGLASGLPISATLIKKEISQTIKLGEHATTFGGGPVVTAAAQATLEIILAEGFLKKVQENSNYLKSCLEKKFKLRGKGFLLGVETSLLARDLVKNCLRNELIIGTSNDKHTVRILPPLNTSKEEIDEFINKFMNSL